MPRRAQSVGPSKVVTRCYKGIRQQLPRRAAAADTEIPASDASNASDAFALHRATAEISQKALQEHGFGSARLSIEDKTEQNGRNTAVQDSDPCLGCIECFGRARLWKRSPLRMHGMLRKCKTMEDRTKRRRTKHISTTLGAVSSKCPGPPCEPAQLKCTWTLRMQHITRESTVKMLRTRISTHTVCETAQSKFTRTLR